MSPVPFCHNAGVTSIGDRIRAARKEAGLSQPAVAREIDCSVATYKRYEQIDSETPPEGLLYLTRIGRFFNIDLSARPAPDDDQPDNPRLSDASKLQLVTALARLIAAEAAEDRIDHDQRNVAPIETRGMPFDTQGHTGDVGPA